MIVNCLTTISMRILHRGKSLLKLIFFIASLAESSWIQVPLGRTQNAPTSQLEAENSPWLEQPRMYLVMRVPTNGASDNTRTIKAINPVSLGKVSSGYAPELRERYTIQIYSKAPIHPQTSENSTNIFFFVLRGQHFCRDLHV